MRQSNQTVESLLKVMAILNPWTLSFLAGFFLALVVFMSLQDGYETRFFKSLSDKVTGSSVSQPTEDTVLIRALHLSHNLLAGRSAIFAGSRRGSWIDDHIHPLSTDLITAENACGSYSVVLCRILQCLDYPVRLAHMEDIDGRVCHILVEARTKRGWVLLDPIYDLYFKTADGHLASFDEVRAGWASYQAQLPRDYNPKYRYAGVSYTNWSSIPVLLPLTRATLCIFISRDRLDHLSLRPFFLRKFRMLQYFFLVAFLLTASGLLIHIIRKNARFSRSDSGRLLNP